MTHTIHQTDSILNKQLEISYKGTNRRKYKPRNKTTMSNLSYCQFENTYFDLLDCYNSLQDKELDELSESEKEYAEKLINLCAKIINVALDKKLR